MSWGVSFLDLQVPNPKDFRLQFGHERRNRPITHWPAPPSWDERRIGRKKHSHLMQCHTGLSIGREMYESASAVFSDRAQFRPPFTFRYAAFREVSDLYSRGKTPGPHEHCIFFSVLSPLILFSTPSSLISLLLASAPLPLHKKGIETW